MRIVTKKVKRIVANIFLPVDNQSDFKQYNCAVFLQGETNDKLPDDESISEFRELILECINKNHDIASGIRFYVLWLLTSNNAIQELLVLQNLYGEILASDSSLVKLFDKSYASLVVAALYYDRPVLLRILKSHNASMHAIIPMDTDISYPSWVNIIKKGRTPFDIYWDRLSFSTFGLRQFRFNMERSVAVLNLLLDTSEEFQRKKLDRRCYLAGNTFREILDEIEERKNKVLVFMQPRTKRDSNARHLRRFLDGCGDNNLPGRVLGCLMG